ncbi:MAG: hypothetical protein ABSA44_10590 [Bacteroidota bacterium]
MPDQRDISIVFKRSPDYKIYPFQTVYGGPVTDMSSILLNVCVDHSAFPNYVTHPVNESGMIEMGTIKDQTQIGNIEREILCGLMIPLPLAKVLVAWLNNHIARMEGS